VSSVPPPSGIDELVAALDEHLSSIDLPARRARSRRMAALAEFTAERGERALRALAGRREAERFLAEQDPTLGVRELVELLGRRSA
jgi:LAO/AO transport system kinase